MAVREQSENVLLCTTRSSSHSNGENKTNIGWLRKIPLYKQFTKNGFRNKKK